MPWHYKCICLCVEWFMRMGQLMATAMATANDTVRSHLRLGTLGALHVCQPHLNYFSSRAFFIANLFIFCWSCMCVQHRCVHFFVQLDNTRLRRMLIILWKSAQGGCVHNVRDGKYFGKLCIFSRWHPVEWKDMLPINVKYKNMRHKNFCLKIWFSYRTFRR